MRNGPWQVFTQPGCGKLWLVLRSEDKTLRMEDTLTLTPDEARDMSAALMRVAGKAMRAKTDCGTLASLHEGDDSWHSGAGWYYTDAEYPDEGSVGAFETKAEAEAHALKAGYVFRDYPAGTDGGDDGTE